MIKIEDIKRSCDRFNELCNKPRLSSDFSMFLRTKSQHSFIIDLYTFWEREIKRLLKDYIMKYQNIIVNDEFIKSYIKKSIQSNRYQRDSFIDNISTSEFSINLDILLHSNNLKYTELISLIKLIHPSNQDISFSEFCNKSIIFKKQVDDIKNLNIPKENGSAIDIEAFINLIVEDRNSLSHSGHIVNAYSHEQQLALIDFFYTIYGLVDEYLFYLMHKDSLRQPEIHLHKIYRENQYNETAIIKVDFRNFSKGETFIIRNSENNIFYRVKIVKIKNENKKTCRVFPKNGIRTLEVNSQIKLKRCNLSKYELHSIDILSSNELSLNPKVVLKYSGQ